MSNLDEVLKVTAPAHCTCVGYIDITCIKLILEDGSSL